MTNADRGPERRASATVRLSAHEKSALESEAAAAGISLQRLLERRIFGAEKPYQPPGRPPKQLPPASSQP